MCTGEARHASQPCVQDALLFSRMNRASGVIGAPEPRGGGGGAPDRSVLRRILRHRGRTDSLHARRSRGIPHASRAADAHEPCWRLDGGDCPLRWHCQNARHPRRCCQGHLASSVGACVAQSAVGASRTAVCGVTPSPTLETPETPGRCCTCEKALAYRCARATSGRLIP